MKNLFFSALRRELKLAKRKSDSSRYYEAKERLQNQNPDWTCVHCDFPGYESDQKRGLDENLCESCCLYFDLYEELPVHRLHLFKYQR